MATLAARITALAEAIRDKINAMMPKLVPAGGTTGQVLSKTSNADHAMGWANAAGGWTQIGSTINTTSGTSASFTSIPQTYSELLFEIGGVSHNGASALALRIETTHNGTTWTTAANITNGTVANSVLVCGSVHIPGFAKGAGLIFASLGDLASDNTLSANAVQVGRHWRHSTGINGVRFSIASDAFDAGFIKLWAR